MKDSRVAIVTLSRYSDLFDGLTDNLNKYAANFDRVLVKDGYLIDDSHSWYTVQGPEGKFVYSVNANLGLRVTDPDSDVLLIGDDVRLSDYSTIGTLYRLAHSSNEIGMLSPRILGGADNPLQTNPPTDADITYSDRYLALVCTYIKRNAIIKTGYLDERFSAGWGWDDVDYSRRMRNAGFKLAVTPKVSVIHGVNRKGSESLVRNEKGDSKAIQAQDDLNARLYFEKWGDNSK
jgi:hypothetical protein